MFPGVTKWSASAQPSRSRSGVHNSGDTVHALIKVDHGYWGAQLYGPYVPEKVAFAIRYHQALRFYEDKEAGYEYPDLYRNLFGEDYVPSPHIQADYKMLKTHKWHMERRL